jgi:hypothetical protein
MSAAGFATGRFVKVPSVPAFAEVPKQTASTGCFALSSAAAAGKAVDPSINAAAVITISSRFMSAKPLQG